MRLLLAISLLFSAHPPDNLHFIAPDMQLVCIASEIMDVRETKYTFTKPDEFVGDLTMMRQRLRDLYDAPRLHECYLLPERVVANEVIQLNRLQKTHYVQTMELYPHDVRFVRIVEDLDERYRVWDYVRDARCEYYYTHIRRQAMKKLVQAIGEEAFSKGELPFPVMR